MSNENKSLCSCGCCEENKALTPAELDNFPGLSALHYRVGTHASFKQSMLAALSKKEATAKLTTRYEDDLSIATLDAWATVLDVLSFYQERIINEGYLHTATERLSVLELAQHISYFLQPGVAASTYLAFSMNESQGAPPRAIIPVGTKVQSVPEQDQLPQIFETTEEIEARVEWNNIKLQTKIKSIPVFGNKEIYLKGIVNNLQPGDGILMIGAERKDDPKNENWDFRKIKKVFIDRDADRTRITWDKGLGKEIHGNTVNPAHDEFKVYALRQKAFLFGYNAPDFRTLSGSVKSEFLSQGIKARYYTSTSSDIFNTFVLERSETEINKTWGSGSPAPGLPADNFSVMWYGSILSPVGGEVTFYTSSDDGVRLYIDGKMVINNWTDHGLQENSVTLMLQAGRLYSFLLQYYEKGGASQIQLSWSGPGLSKQIIPAANFFMPGDFNDWPGYTITAIAGEEKSIHLDAIYSKIIKGSWIVLAKETYDEVYEVDESVESSRKNFTLTAKTTKLKIKGENLDLFENNVRDAIVFGQSEELEMAEKPVTSSPSGNQITLEKVLPDFPKGKMIIISGKRQRIKITARRDVSKLRSITSADTQDLHPGDSLIIVEVPAIKGKDEQTIFTLQDNTGFVGTISLWLPEWEFASAEEKDAVISETHKVTLVAADNYSTTLTLGDNLATYFDRSSVIVYANLAASTHGETIRETLGSGNSSQIFQKFELKQKPVTYISAATSSGNATTLEIRVNDILWKEVPSFYGASANEKIYITRIDNDGKVTVQFGDGITGARLPTGTENVKAKYRSGIGTDGLMNAGQLSMLMTPQLGLNKVTNPLAASGADDPETFDKAKQNAPITVLTLDRIVSATDFEDFARAFAGISKAKSDVLWNGEQQVVVITVAAADQQPIDDKSELYTNLNTAIKTSGHFYKTIYLENYDPVLFTVNAKIKIDPAYLFDSVRQNVVTSLQKGFSFEERDFGQDVTPSEIITVIQDVEGVLFVDLELLNGKNPFTQGDHYRITSERARWSGMDILPAQLLTIDSTKIIITEIVT
jgi:hypothetical protein